MNLNKHFLKQAGLFLLFVIGFWFITLWYLAPPSEGMVLKQGDMQQVRLMRYAAEQVKETTGTLPQWNDRLFSGMPGSLITGIEQGSLLLKYKVIELFGLVKSPFNFLFVAMLSMFVLLLSVKVDRWLAAAGAIGYAFMTFSISSYEEPAKISVGSSRNSLVLRDGCQLFPLSNCLLRGHHGGLILFG